MTPLRRASALSSHRLSAPGRLRPLLRWLAPALASGLGAGGAHAVPLIFDGGVTNTISTAVTADSSFWVGENTPSNNVTIASPGGSVQVNTGNSASLGVNVPSSGNSLTVNGGLTVADSTDVGYASASNTLTINSGGTTSTGDIKVGVLGTATSNSLVVNAGGQLNNSNVAQVGVTAGATGNAVTVTGAGATWQSTGVLTIGHGSSNNSLTVSGGGSVTHLVDALIGSAVGTDNNSLIVTGTGSLLSTVNNTLYIGRGGNNNSAQIDSGGQIQSRNVRIGGGTGATGVPTGNSATVDGSGSTWSITGTLRVGAGTGGTSSSLTVSNGGSVTVGGNSFLGYDATSASNTVSVTGAGSSLNLQALTVGNVLGSTGNLVSVANGATLGAASITLGDGSGLDIGAGGTPGTVTVTSGTITSGAGSGAYVRFNHTSGAHTFGLNLTGSLRVDHAGTGTTTLTGANTYSGATNVTGGVLNFGASSPSSVASATASGTGFLAVQSGTTLTSTGTYSQTGSGGFRTHVTGPSTYGVLSVVGAASLATGSRIDVSSSVCGSHYIGQVIPSVITSSSPITLGGVTVTDNCPAVDFSARLNGASTGVDLVVVAPSGSPTTAIPVLGPWGLVVLAGLLGGLGGRRRRLG